MNKYAPKLVDVREYLELKGYARVGSKTKEFFLYFVKFDGSPLSVRGHFEEFNDSTLQNIHTILRRFVEYGIAKKLPPDMDSKGFSGFRYEPCPEVRNEAWMLLKEFHLD